MNHISKSSGGIKEVLTEEFIDFNAYLKKIENH
jgi:hypothetical protein